MKALHSVILKVDRNYNNQELIGDIEYTVNVSIDNVISINREATIVVAPEGSDLYPGDKVVVHHNIMRENINVSDKLDKGVFYISNGYYWCPVSEVLLKKDSKGEWKTLLDFVFVKPIKEENIHLNDGLVLVPDSHKGMKDLRGVLAITNDKLKGVDVGDTIVFSINSEHEFIIDGELHYKCEVEDILGKL